MKAPLFLVICFLLSSIPVAAAQRVSAYLSRPAEWFATTEARQLGSNILTWQAPNGSWPKNLDTVSTLCPNQSELKGTFDNGATLGELRFLAKLRHASESKVFEDAFLRGLQTILKAQYPNGGWPQSYPPGSGYARHITFNDNTFVRLAEFVRDVAQSAAFEFVDPALRKDAGRAVTKTIDCILKTQIRVGDELTVWCAQHDEKSLEPRPARAYELVSLSGSESAALLLFLMSLEKPSLDVRRSVEAGVKWFEKVKIEGVRVKEQSGNRVLLPNSEAPPLWARFYEIGTNRPMFSGRDGVKKYSLSEIDAERRNGYAWYGNWGAKVLAQYPKWKALHGAP